MCCFQTSRCVVGSCLSECWYPVMVESDVQWLGGERWEETVGREEGEGEEEMSHALVTGTATLMERVRH